MLTLDTEWGTSLGFFLKAGTALFITALPIVYPAGSQYFFKRRNRNLTPPLSPTSPFKLPYFAPDIPHPLPEHTEIEKGTILFKRNGHKVVQVGTEFIVKCGPASQIDLLEGVNMLFVQQATKVKVPRVYALYNDPESSRNYIVMEFIEGHSLDTQWAHLTDFQKCEIATTLRQYFDELRNLPSPGFFGSIGRKHLLHSLFWTPQPTPAINGPFNSEAELNEGLALKYIGESEYSSTYKADYYRRSFSHVFRGHGPKFTHGDIQRKNIMIKQLPNNANNGQFEVTLVDWETAGWYPSYWEYSTAMSAIRWDDDWGAWVAKILQPFNAEFPWLYMLYLELWS
ncbi:hypothetical protein AJ78_02923 [Emergomyces pasteurianus Ep9510]|uniref:Aminoglycoside phosphotransferase domain-containing protein n=1 Tax=Emergomyces pasteurianus Ep9510 TaxID=1447872 RepID=A0A1J9QNW1_9EURO|nr:hypothetical protein AJ78_02923 [Emergomyces pasteurianus Ep9510]